MPSRILVIDDDPIARRLVGYLVTAQGYEVVTAADGAEGVARARADQPDLVLCDVQLPDIDGCEVLRLLKADPSTASIPVVAMTAAITDAEQQRIDAAGFDLRAQKPLDPAKFGTSLAAWLGGRA